MKISKISCEAIIFLLYLKKSGEKSLNYLIESLQYDRNYLLHIVKALRNRGLLYLSKNNNNDFDIRITRKGLKMCKTSQK